MADTRSHFGPQRRNTKWCVRCEDEPAQPPHVSVFALGQHCINEVFVEAKIADASMRDENGVHTGYAMLMATYGYRPVQ